jgi:hypothetical protein
MSPNTHHLSNELVNLFTFMLQPDPAFRLTMAEIATHPWVTNPNIPTAEQVKAYFDGKAV